MVDARDNRGGVVGEIFFGLLTLFSAWATYATVGIAIRGYPNDHAIAAIVVVPALATIGFGAALLVLEAGRRSAQRFALLQQRHPDQPWLWEPDRWKDGRLRDRSGIGLAITFVLFALFWNGMIGIATVAMYRQGALFAAPQGVLLAVFGVVGVGLIAAAVYFVASAMKFSATILQMDAVPGVLGGPLSATVLLPPQVPDGTDATVTLDCTVHTRGRGRNATSSSHCLWKDNVHARASGGCLTAAFTVPFDMPPTDFLNTGKLSTVHWYVSVAAKLPGVDYSAIFSVPVFATPASDRFIAAGSVSALAAAPASVVRPANAKASIVESEDGTAVITFPKAAGLGCGVVAFVLLTLLGWPVARAFGAEPAVAANVFGMATLVGAGILALSIVGVRLTVVRIDIGNRAMLLSYGRRPFTRSREIPLADVTEIKYAVSGQTTAGQVTALTSDGKACLMAGDLSSVDEAKWLATEVTRLVERARTSSPDGQLERRNALT